MNREREWLFGTQEGRTMLVESSNFDRLAVIHLHREHKYESLKDTQDETADTIVRLAPKRKDSEPRPVSLLFLHLMFFVFPLINIISQHYL